MSWRVITGDPAWSDIDRLSDADRAIVAEGLMTWTEGGPLRAMRRVIAGVELYEDDIAKCRVTYLVNEVARRVTIVRVRRLR